MIADIAGGIGSQLVATLDAHPSVRGILFDQPQVVANAIPHPRMERVGGDFFKSVPAGADAYTMRWIIHDWPDSESIAIMTNIRKAMKPDSRLILIEEIIPDGPELTWAKWLDFANARRPRKPGAHDLGILRPFRQVRLRARPNRPHACRIEASSSPGLAPRSRLRRGVARRGGLRPARMHGTARPIHPRRSPSPVI